MKISKLRSVIDFQKQVATPNATFGVDLQWRTKIVTRGNVKQTSGLKFDKGVNIDPSVTAIITVRYNAKITRDLRLNIGQTFYKIVKLIKLEEDKNRYLEIHVQQEEEVS